jgi:septation ring formation regulator EzrA
VTDPQSLFNTVIAVAGAACAWVIKMIYDSIRALQAADSHLADSIEEVRENYARRDDVKDMSRRIETTLDRIEKKLDGKADK